MKLAQLTPAPLSDHQIPESDNVSDSSGLELVNLAQPATRPPSPGQPVIPSQLSRPKAHPLPHHVHQEVLLGPYQAWRLLHFNPLNLDIHFSQLRND